MIANGEDGVAGKDAPVIGVKEEDIPALAVAAFNDVCTGGNPRPTSVGDIEKLYRTAF